jgi:hypothetical protein
MCTLSAILPIKIMLSADEPPGTINRVSQSSHVKFTAYLHEKLPYCGLCGPAVTLGLTKHHLHRHISNRSAVIITRARSCLRNLAGCKYETNESKASPVVGVTSLTLYSQLVNIYTIRFNIHQHFAHRISFLCFVWFWKQRLGETWGKETTWKPQA